MAVEAAENDMRPEEPCDGCSHVIHAREQERRRIARELHDGIAQDLTVVAVALKTLANDKNSPDIHGCLAELSTQLAAVGSELHRVSRNLHPATLDLLGLEAAIRAFCADLTSTHHVRVQLLIQNVPRPLTQDIELCVYRITQEALNNVVRHSGAATATVTLEGMQDQIVLTVNDTGVGFDPHVSGVRPSLGLRSMRERVELVDGQFLIRSAKCEGTRIEVRVPCRSVLPARPLTATTTPRASL
jgi:signal transduction histidine kinase